MSPVQNRLFPVNGVLPIAIISKPMWYVGYSVRLSRLGSWVQTLVDSLFLFLFLKKREIGFVCSNPGEYNFFFKEKVLIQIIFQIVKYRLTI